MADTTTQTYVTREPDWMEAYRRGLIEDVKGVTAQAPQQLAEYQVAGMAPEQVRATMLASQGIGAYQPYLQQAGNLYGTAGSQYGLMSGYGNLSVDALQRAQAAAQPYVSGAQEAYGAMRAGAGAGAGTAAEYGREAGQYISGAQRAAQPYLSRAESAYGEMGPAGMQGVGTAAGYGATAAGLGMQGAQAYNPQSVSAYMNPFQQEVTQQTLAEMNRQAAIQQQNVASQAVKAGAFGGSRFGVQQAELGRNLAQAQGQVIAQQNAQNYSQAQQAAMEAFQNQQARTQQAGQMALGAGSLAANTMMQNAQLQGQQAQGLAALGQQRFGMGQAGAQTALSAGQLASGAQLSAASMQGQAGQGIANLGQQQFGMGQALGQANISAGQLTGQAGQGYAGLGASQAALGQQATALGQGDVSFMYNIGSNLQAQQQKILDAQRMNQALYNAEPYQRLSYYADILNKTPSGQMSMTQTTAPTPSPFSQIAGLGIAGLGVYNAANKAGSSLWGGQ